MEVSEKGECKLFVYHDGTEHMYNPKIHNTFVLISTIRIINDFFKAVEIFINEVISSPDLKSRADSRIKSLFRVIPAQK